MRLIDADTFEKFIKEKYKDGESTDDIKDQMLFDLSYQPTAYNVDAVAEYLKKCSDGYKNSSWEYEQGKSFAYGNAADMVRRG